MRWKIKDDGFVKRLHPLRYCQKDEAFYECIKMWEFRTWHQPGGLQWLPPASVCPTILLDLQKSR